MQIKTKTYETQKRLQTQIILPFFGAIPFIL